VLLAAGVVVVLFATQWDLWIGLAVRQVTDDAYVRGDITPLSAQIEGYVRRVPVDAGPCDLWWLAIPSTAALARIIIAMDYDQSGIATTYDEARALTPERRRR
jgi:hypothetical protein